MSTRPNPKHPRVEEDVIPGVSKSLQFTIKLLELQKPCSRTPRCISRHEFEVILRDWMLASRKINERIRNIVLQSGYTISAAGQLEELNESRDERERKSRSIATEQNNAVVLDILVKALSSKTPDRILALKSQRCSPSVSNAAAFLASTCSESLPPSIDVEGTSLGGNVQVSTIRGTPSLVSHFSTSPEKHVSPSGTFSSNRRSYIPRPKASPDMSSALYSPIKLSKPPILTKVDKDTARNSNRLSGPLMSLPTKPHRAVSQDSPKTPTPRARAQTLSNTSIKSTTPLHPYKETKRLSLHARASASPIGTRLPGVWK